MWRSTRGLPPHSGGRRPTDRCGSAARSYWQSRPRGSQLSATVSIQGQEIATRHELEVRVAELSARSPEALPLPPMWGGYLIVPRTVELWESRADRLHDRVEYRRAGDGTWNRRRLQP